MAPMHYKEVTRELVHEIPSQLPPQGSDPTQLGGVFVQPDMSDFRARTASKIIISSRSSSSTTQFSCRNYPIHPRKSQKKKKRKKLFEL